MKIWFVTLFLGAVILAMFYQKNYLSNLEEQFKNQKINYRQMLAQGTHFKMTFYDGQGRLSSSFSGNKIIYYDNDSFTADGNLIYETYDELLNSSSLVKTEFAEGEFISSSEKNVHLISESKKIAYIRLTQNVSFRFNEMAGETKNIFMDTIKRTIESNEHINLIGSNGSVSADGFFYDIDKKELKLKSHVFGSLKTEKQALHKLKNHDNKSP